MSYRFFLLILTTFLFWNLGFAQSNIQLANEAYSKGNFSLAEGFLNQEIQQKPSGIAYYNRGVTRLAKEDYFKAINDFDSSISLNYKTYDSYNRRGYAQYHTKNYSGAVEDFKKVISQSNQNELISYAYRFISLSFIRIQDFPAAEEWCNKGLEAFPNEKNLLFNKGFVFYSLKSYQKAIVEFDKRLQITPNHIESLLWKAEALTRLGNDQEAQMVLEKVVAIQSNQVVAYSQLAMIYQKTGQKTKFKETLTTLSYLGYKADFLEVNLAITHIEEGNLEEALTLLNQSIDNNKHNASALLNRSIVYYRKK